MVELSQLVTIEDHLPDFEYFLGEEDEDLRILGDTFELYELGVCVPFWLDEGFDGVKERRDMLLIEVESEESIRVIGLDVEIIEEVFNKELTVFVVELKSDMVEV